VDEMHYFKDLVTGSHLGYSAVFKWSIIGATSPTQSGKDNCSLQLTAVGNGNLLLGSTGRAAQLFNRLDKVHALLDLTEDDVSAVKPVGNDGGDEELGAVAVVLHVSIC
jgi:hypothetical protein